MDSEATQNIIFDYLQDVTSPFTLNDLFTHTRITRTSKIEEEIQKLILSVDEFVADDSSFYPKISFLRDIPIRIMPTEFEIKKGILIPGHRLLPFYPGHLALDEISFSFANNKTPIKSKTIDMKMADLHVYFNLMDLQRIPIINIEDLLEDGADLKIQVFNLRPFYKTYDFKFGDTFIARSADFSEGVFTLDYDSYENYEAHIFRIEKLDKQFMSTLKKVIKQDLFFPNVEKQLLYTYFYLKRNKNYQWDVPCTPVGPLLGKTRDVTFSPLPNGRTIFHFVDQSVDDLAVYPDFEDLLEGEDEEFDLDTIEGILRFLNNTNGLTIVRALVFDMVTEGKRFNYTDIENYLFDGLEKPYMPKEFRKRFKPLVQEEYNKVKRQFDLKYAFLPITTARKQILEEALEISRFLRSLDEAMVALDELPKNEMMHLMELDRAFNEILMELDQSQINGKCDSSEIHRVLKIVGKVSSELPQLFDVIRIKLEL
jgi:hypothetical protein